VKKDNLDMKKDIADLKKDIAHLRAAGHFSGAEASAPEAEGAKREAGPFAEEKEGVKGSAL